MLVFIDKQWYDLGKWASHHPGGEEILQQFDGHDATDAFFSLHSTRAVAMLKRLPVADVKQGAPEEDPVDLEYRKLRAKLESEGWFERTLRGELSVLGPIVVLAVLGTVLAWSHPLLAVLCLSVAMQQGGWLGHDFVHARNSKYCRWMAVKMSGFLNGFSRDWWSRKHNAHHVLTNHIGADPDIDMMPFIFLWAPPKSLDHHLRKYQHLYFVVLYPVLYISWRIQSLQFAWARAEYRSLLVNFLPGYLWLACLPLKVVLGALLLGGWLVAIVVTASHESEEMVTLDKRPASFVRNQFATTRDILCPDPLSEFLCGGMQYQLEHHLFPTLPRYKYAQLQPVVRAFAKRVGLEYKADGLLAMTRLHLATLKRNGRLQAVDDK